MYYTLWNNNKTVILECSVAARLRRLFWFGCFVCVCVCVSVVLKSFLALGWTNFNECLWLGGTCVCVWWPDLQSGCTVSPGLWWETSVNKTGAPHCSPLHLITPGTSIHSLSLSLSLSHAHTYIYTRTQTHTPSLASFQPSSMPQYTLALQLPPCLHIFAYTNSYIVWVDTNCLCRWKIMQNTLKEINVARRKYLDSNIDNTQLRVIKSAGCCLYNEMQIRLTMRGKLNFHWPLQNWVNFYTSKCSCLIFSFSDNVHIVLDTTG